MKRLSTILFLLCLVVIIGVVTAQMVMGHTPDQWSTLDFGGKYEFNVLEWLSGR
jgi:hypothetical protein